ncbi:aspartate carbamoyltransferase catalytic subunit [Pelagovum pacificum]|uniref:Aspartate carbamoyltransferase catalytic subunit n=1 Tax=Pelagovum pacificum TaxID=2588711 RepID=A0A5C5GJL1_9RHOB|nr:aspartate carbamoyltransferase catalytic subunit [Pelagovum pacificum]QQA43224.1 aspartate carbamoyltransferase catalytic subunit [Pelagovum pacificum]TNY33636.1 aspartate carbamoyltransferase catalytic subunit [Pelagovum pacificum]
MTATISTAPSGWEGILDDGETVRWQGRPRSGLSFAGYNLFEGLMGGVFVVFSLFWMSMAFSMGPPRDAPGPFALFPYFGLIFLFIGLWNAIGRFLWSSYLMTRTYYTLTDKRAFIAVDHPFRGRTLSDWPIDETTEIRLFDGDPATVRFAYDTRTVTSSRNGRRRTRTVRTPIEFARIDDGREVYRIMRGIKMAAEGNG